MNLDVGQRFSHYEILERVGSGGMGAVYKAKDVRLKRTVALKFLLSRSGEHPEQMRRFLREAQSAAAVSHAGIAHVYEIDEQDGLAFLAMEFLSGGSVRDRMSSGRPSLDHALRWCGQIAEALAEAHRHGIIHRDVKPSNILLDDQGHAKLVDFGLARETSIAPAEATATRLTAEGVILGTLAYMSPEQALGRPVGPASDVFSFGCVMYELVGGRPPFERKTHTCRAASVFY